MAIVTIDTAFALILNGLLTGAGIFIAIYVLGKLAIKRMPGIIHLVFKLFQEERAIQIARAGRR